MHENVKISEEYREVINSAKQLVELSSKVQLMDLCTHIISLVMDYNVRLKQPCTAQQILDSGLIKNVPFEVTLNASILDYFISMTALRGILKVKRIFDEKEHPAGSVFDEKQLPNLSINAYYLKIFRF